MQTSLWGSEFIAEQKVSKDKIINKVNNPKNVSATKEINLKSKKLSISDKLSIINAKVIDTLGIYSDSTKVIKTADEFSKYIDESINNGIIAIDTETNNSLDPLTCKLMGLCLYTPGNKSVYIPINHTDLLGNRLDWQINEKEVNAQLTRLLNSKILMHNGKFDYQVLKCTCNVELNIYWDSMVAAKVLDENEKSAGLKQQYIDKIDSSIEKYSIDKLFESIEYKYVDPEIFALYAATDAYMTYKLYEYQYNILSQKNNSKLLSLLLNIEIPVVTVSAEMELTGVCIDSEYSKRLSDKYHKKLLNIDNKIDKELNRIENKISSWRLSPEANMKYYVDKSSREVVFVPASKESLCNQKLSSKTMNEQLDSPPLLTSSVQLGILLYDVLKIPQVSVKTTYRGTGEDILKQIDNPLCALILEKRGIIKLINTYIDKLPECVSKKDNRLHAHFNQYGAQTGRFSSSDPNLQNIPSHENSIRMMFTASDGYTLIGGDFSQQEPRLLSHFSNDSNMINAYKENKDLYATIAAKVYKNNYEDNLEFNPITHNIQPEGKKRRTSCKSLLLGIMYGRGSASIAEALNCSIQEAEDIKQGFFDAFPNVEKWVNQTISDAHTTGYVEDVWGRRRRLPDILLDRYSLESINKTFEFNPLLGTQGKYLDKNINEKNDYISKLMSCKYKRDVDKLKAEISSKGYKIRDNTGFVSQSERQCINARIQGSAASMSKRAMINVYNNKELNSLGFRLLIAVHDELIGECPIENKERCKELLSECMVKSALPEVTVPFKCDTDDFKSWYLDVYTSEVKKDYNKLCESNTEEEAFNILCADRCECLPEQLENMLKDN